VLSAARTQYPEQFDAYFRDNFGWRDRLIRWHNLFKFRYLRQSPVANVVVGRDGWLFYAGTGDGVDFRDFAGRWPLQPGDLDVWLRHLDHRVQEYAQLGARYLVVIAPNKQSMYPEHVPPQYGPHAPGLLEKFLRRLRSYPRVEVLDLEPALRPHRDGPIYFRGDSHWNHKGAFHAARAITDRLRHSLPALGVLREEDYVLHSGPYPTGDLVNMLALGITVADETYEYRRRTPGARNIRNEHLHRVWVQPERPLPKAVLLGDSYGGVIAPILADAFSRLHYYMSSHAGVDPSLVREERPDVVILLNVERYLPLVGAQ
jgi:hypothetical protein